VNASARPTVPAATEDWRLLRALSLYRLLLDTLFLVLFDSGAIGEVFGADSPVWFQRICVAYALAALALLWLVFRRRPRIERQALLHFATDLLALGGLLFVSGGVSSGLGVLLITPAVGCSLVLGTGTALALPAVATAALSGEELLRAALRHSPPGYAGIALLGVILFGSTLAANAVARRARASEALAARVELDLRKLAQLNQRIVEQMATGVLVLDEQRRIRLLNAAARRLLASAEPAGADLAERFPELAAALAAWEHNPAREPEPLAPWAGALEVIPRFMRLGGGALLVLLDDASRLRDQAQQMKLAALGRLSAGIAHEIRNPLAAIHQASQLLAESPRFGAQERRLLDMIQRHGARLDKIVRDVLSLSRRDAAAPSRLALREFLERSIAVYREGRPAAAGALDCTAVPAHLEVRFDPHQLQQVLHNLWDNSFEHGFARGEEPQALRITLCAGRLYEQGPVWLDIADNGRGVLPEVRDRIFEPFFTTAHQGTGLGLYLARELCEYNHARLLLLPAERGARMRLIFAN
jgi:two-component system sensor histidine kinase PilS (NtrC family)